jgi:hypothetical protein
MICYSKPPFEDRFLLRDGPTFETEVLAYGADESKEI